ncbi:MAG: aldo/keto reductase, partial [Polyangiaceae bacterium]
ETLRRAATVCSIAALQSEYSLWTRDVESDVLATCAELGVAFVPYSPLGRGFLTGQLTPADISRPGDLRPAIPRFSEANFAKNSDWLSPLREVAEEAGATMAQVALAWVLSRNPFIYPIPGARRAEHLRANFAASGLILPAHELAQLTSHFVLHAAAGARLPPQLLSAVNV